MDFYQVLHAINRYSTPYYITIATAYYDIGRLLLLALDDCFIVAGWLMVRVPSATPV